MKIRLIEPEPPGMHVWAKVLSPPRPAHHRGGAQGAGPRRAHLQPPDGAHRLGRRLQRRPRRALSTTSRDAAYAFADELRARGIPVVIGGSHVTFMAEEALEHADYVARGEGGEPLMLELIEALRGARELGHHRRPLVPARRRDRPQPAARALRRPRRAALPRPPLWSAARSSTTTPIMTSWGCPFACNFCSVTAMFGRKYRFRSAESVIAEIKDKRPRRIFFYDDNFAADKRRLKTLLRMMIAEDLVIPWSAQVRTDVARDPELLELMRRSGCELVYLGLESVNQATLDGYEKSQTVDDIGRPSACCTNTASSSHGMFVLGADTDDVQTVRDTVQFAIENRIDTVMLNILTPLPGTPQFEELDAAGPHLRKRWQLYDAQHVVFEPSCMTPYELQMEVIRGYCASSRCALAALPLRPQAHRASCFSAGWGKVIMQNWGNDERNRAFIRAQADVAQADVRPRQHARRRRRGGVRRAARGQSASSGMVVVSGTSRDDKVLDLTMETAPLRAHLSEGVGAPRAPKRRRCSERKTTDCSPLLPSRRPRPLPHSSPPSPPPPPSPPRRRA